MMAPKRLPSAAALSRNWRSKARPGTSTSQRDSPITWRDDPILSATQAALLPDGRVSVQEGYIRIAPGGTDGGDG